MNGNYKNTKYKIVISNDNPINLSDDIEIYLIESMEQLNNIITDDMLKTNTFKVISTNFDIILYLVQSAIKYSNNMYVYKNDELMLYGENLKFMNNILKEKELRWKK